MQISGTRFGEIDVDLEKLIVLRGGLIGFPKETRFVLLRPTARNAMAWLQSVETPALAFPVVESRRIVPSYARETEEALAEQAGIDGEKISVLVIVSVRPSRTSSSPPRASSDGRVASTRAKPAKVTANLLAPIVIDRSNGNGAQVVLDAKRYSPSTPLASMAGTQVHPVQ